MQQITVLNLFLKEVNGSTNSLREILTKNAFLKLAEPFSGHCLTKKNKNAIYMSNITLPSVSAAKHQLSRACTFHWPVCD